MPWDCFCPQCTAVVVGSMTDGDEMEKEMQEYKGQIVMCESCGTFFDFDTNKIIVPIPIDR